MAWACEFRGLERGAALTNEMNPATPALLGDLAALNA